MAEENQDVALVDAQGHLYGAPLEQVSSLDAQVLAAAKAYTDGYAVRDTGWRAIGFDASMAEALDPNVPANGAYFCHIRRVGSACYMRGFAKISKTFNGNRITTVPAGFRAGSVAGSTNWSYNGQLSRQAGGAVNSTGGVQYSPTASAVYGSNMTLSSAWSDGCGFYLTWPTEQIWPAVLPGTAA